MLDVTTTITINGPAGERFLESLARCAAPVPPALHRLAASPYRSILVDVTDADQVAQFVEQLIAAGWHVGDQPPLLFSPRVGDRVILRRDALVEVGREAPGLPPTWRFVQAGSRGVLLGWRDREDDSRAIVDLLASEHRLIIFVAERRITRAPRPLVARHGVGRRRRPTH